MSRQILGAVILATVLFITSCNRISESENINQVIYEFGDNQANYSRFSSNNVDKEYIGKIISATKETIIHFVENNNIELNDQNINQYLLKRFEYAGLKINKETPSQLKLSSEFYKESYVIVNASNFESEFDYINFLNSKVKDIKNGNFNFQEKQILLEEIEFQIQLVEMISSLESQYSVNSEFNKKGWWKSWGRCVAGTLGGALTGAGTLGLAGAAIGTVTLPVVGTVSAGAVGAIVGGVGGGLTGAAASC